jgi:hypothetical protein
MPPDIPISVRIPLIPATLSLRDLTQQPINTRIPASWLGLPLSVQHALRGLSIPSIPTNGASSETTLADMEGLPEESRTGYRGGGFLHRAHHSQPGSPRLRRILTSYIDYYHRWRTQNHLARDPGVRSQRLILQRIAALKRVRIWPHPMLPCTGTRFRWRVPISDARPAAPSQSLEMDCPRRRDVHDFDRGRVVELDHLGGLHHHYGARGGLTPGRPVSFPSLTQPHNARTMLPNRRIALHALPTPLMHGSAASPPVE